MNLITKNQNLVHFPTQHFVTDVRIHRKSISYFSLNFHLNFHFLNGFITICDFSIFCSHLRGRKTLLGNMTKNQNLPASITNILKYIYIKFQGISRVLLLPWGSANIIPVMLEVQMQVPPEGVLLA